MTPSAASRARGTAPQALSWPPDPFQQAPPAAQRALRALRPAAAPVTALALLLACAIGCGPKHTPASPTPPQPALRGVWTPDDVVLDVACTPTGLESCFDAVDNNCNGVIDEGCGVRTGIVQFSVAWADPTADVDLFVTDPKGNVARVHEATELGLVKDRDCPGERDACQGQNTENVYLVTRQVPRGRFRVLVRLTRLGQTRPPLRVQFGARVGQRSYGAVLELEAVDDERLLTFEM